MQNHKNRKRIATEHTPRATTLATKNNSMIQVRRNGCLNRRQPASLQKIAQIQQRELTKQMHFDQNRCLTKYIAKTKHQIDIPNVTTQAKSKTIIQFQQCLNKKLLIEPNPGDISQNSTQRTHTSTCTRDMFKATSKKRGA